MDYYRKLLRAKAFDEKEPDMPGKKKGYKSIYQFSLIKSIIQVLPKKIKAKVETHMNQDKDKEKMKKTMMKIMMIMIIYSVRHFSAMIYLEEIDEIKEKEMKKIKECKLNLL